MSTPVIPSRDRARKTQHRKLTAFCEKVLRDFEDLQPEEDDDFELWLEVGGILARAQAVIDTLKDREPGPVEASFSAFVNLLEREAAR